ncbi:AAA family ATPase [Lysobacter sp. K5869]|uniref:AAA family ATPase n=1 Tax=Lysobacter sp. K5869 TaxID=2820808 RepID=UPI001C05FD04|nr:AAA family ATPase [Lysobacter sp. K5869]QWP79195.1 AAA family ATPase [Lysobacter sp. K5869]
MSTVTVIIGKSGAGKTASLRGMDPAQTLLVQVVKKPLPFKSGAWKHFHPENCPTGNIFTTDQAATILKIAAKTSRKVIVIDDFQYMLANELMRRSDERGYDKFTDIAKHGWEVFTVLSTLPDDVRVYLLSHSQEDENGTTKLKTIGKMLDEKIVLEGLVSIVLRATVTDGKHEFSTRNSGADTVKAPMGLFDEERIPNDLKLVDDCICEFYEIAPASTNREAA